MRRIVPLALMLAAGSAAADPIARPCTVKILRAPDAVRAEVAAWVAREPKCSVALEVRIVPTEGGLYLIARDERGRIYERVLPDGQSAGVLIASWMADDSMPAAAPVVTPPPAPEPAPELPTMPLGFIADPATMIDSAPRDAGTDRASHWLSVQGRFGSSKAVRAELDLLTFGHWAVGVSATLGQGEMVAQASSPTGFESGAAEATTDFQGLVYLVRQIELGRWHVRPAIALGASNTTLHIVDNNYPALLMTSDVHVVSPMVELSFIVTRELGRDWAIEGGIALAAIPQQIVISSPDLDYADINRPLEIELVLGLGHRL